MRLFERSRAGVTLTDAGARFRDGVAAGLAAIQRGAAEAAELATAEQVVIACSHEASHFFLIPRYDALQRELGEDVRIRILTYHHYVKNLPVDPSADILMTWDAAGVATEDRVVAHRRPSDPSARPPMPPPTRTPSPGPSPLERADVYRPAAAQRGLGVMGRLVRGRWKPGRGAALPRTRQLHPRPGSGRRRAWHRAGLAVLHRAATGIRHPGCASATGRRIRQRLLQRAHREGTPQAARAPVPWPSSTGPHSPAATKPAGGADCMCRKRWFATRGPGRRRGGPGPEPRRGCRRPRRSPGLSRGRGAPSHPRAAGRRARRQGRSRTRRTPSSGFAERQPSERRRAVSAGALARSRRGPPGPRGYQRTTSARSTRLHGSRSQV